MVVVPQLVWSYTLFVDEGVALLDVLEFGQPCLLAHEGDADLVFDQQSVMHNFRDIANNFKAHIAGCDRIEICRRAYERPGFFDGGLNGLFAV